MDIQYLSNLFATTYNPDPNVRKQGEAEIRSIASQEGLVTALMQIIGAEGADLGVRQACAVYLKNRVQRAYFIDPTRSTTEQTPIPESDRVALKQNLFHLLVIAPNRPIRVQISSCFKTMVSHDFPERWPGLLDEILRLLNSDDPRAVYGALVAHLEIIKACRFRLSDDIVPTLVPQTFPILVALGSKFATNPTPESAEYLHVIIKSYRASTQVSLSKHQQSPQSIVPWGTLFFQVINMQISPDLLPADPAEREKTGWWKAKKWAYRTLNRLFDRYGNPTQLPSPMKKDYSQFAEHFVTSFAPEIFTAYLHQVELYIKKEIWISDKCLHAIFQYFTSCVKPKSTWHLLKPHLDSLVAGFIFPHLCFDQVKDELWHSDPVEYIRITMEEYDDYNSPMSAATSFLLGLCSNRTKTAFMPILTFINSVLGSSRPPAEKFGALNMTVALGGIIMRHPTVKNAMENFLVAHVLPEFTSPHPFMRAVASETVGTLERFQLEWSKPENLEHHFRALVTAIDDPELPVRVPAAMSLTHMIRHEAVRQALAPGVGKIIQDLFKLSDETDLDMFTEAMESFIEVFQEELLPVAAQLISRLCESYNRLMAEHAIVNAQDSNRDADNSSVDLTVSPDDKTFPLMGVVKTIGAVIDALETVEGSQDLLLHVEELVIPIIKLTFEHQAVDLYDSMFQLVDSFTFKLRQIAPNMWPIFELTYKLFKGNAIDFLDDMLPSLDNFISYGKEVFAQKPEYRQMVIDIYTTAMTSPQLGENDRVDGCKLGESIFLHLRGQVDEAVPSMIAPVLEIMSKPTMTKPLKLASLEVVVNAILYNPVLTIHVLEASGPGVSREFFDRWFAAVQSEDGLPRVHDKKLSIIALCGLLEMDPAAVPESLKQGWASIVAGILNIFKDLPKAYEARQQLIESLGDEDDDDDSKLDASDLLELNDDDDKDVWDEDSEYLELLAKEGDRLRKEREVGAARGEPIKEVDADEISESSDEDESISEELQFESPLDSIDPYVTFKHALTAFQMRNPSGYQVATTSLGPEAQTLLMEVMAQAEEKDGAVPSQ